MFLFKTLFCVNGKSLKYIYVIETTKCRIVWVTGRIMITEPINRVQVHVLINHLFGKGEKRPHVQPQPRSLRKVPICGQLLPMETRQLVKAHFRPCYKLGKQTAVRTVTPKGSFTFHEVLSQSNVWKSRHLTTLEAWRHLYYLISTDVKRGGNFMQFYNTMVKSISIIKSLEFMNTQNAF